MLARGFVCRWQTQRRVVRSPAAVVALRMAKLAFSRGKICVKVLWARPHALACRWRPHLRATVALSSSWPATSVGALAVAAFATAFESVESFFALADPAFADGCLPFQASRLAPDERLLRVVRSIAKVFGHVNALAAQWYVPAVRRCRPAASRQPHSRFRSCV